MKFPIYNNIPKYNQTFHLRYENLMGEFYATTTLGFWILLPVNITENAP